MNPALLAQAQAFVDRKYVARADERQKSMGLAYVEVERQDLAREIVRFAAGLVAGTEAPALGAEKHPPGFPSVKRDDFKEHHYLILEAAEQIGFEPINGDATEYFVTDEWLIEFVSRIWQSVAAHIAATEARAIDAEKRLNALRCAIRVGDGQ